MKRTTVSLPDELADALSREARRRHRSVSEVTREALAAHLGFAPGQRRELPFAALGDSGQAETGQNIKAMLAKEWSDPARDR